MTGRSVPDRKLAGLWIDKPPIQRKSHIRIGIECQCLAAVLADSEDSSPSVVRKHQRDNYSAQFLRLTQR